MIHVLLRTRRRRTAAAFLVLVALLLLSLAGCGRKPPPWADDLGKTSIRYDALVAADVDDGGEVRLGFQFGPPSVESADSEAGRDWSTWVHHDVLISVDKGPASMGLSVHAIGADDVERPCLLRGGLAMPEAGNKAKRILLIPNVPELKALEFGGFGKFKFRVKYDAGTWSVVDTPERAKLRRLDEKGTNQSNEARTGPVVAAELRRCCDAIDAMSKAANGAEKERAGLVSAGCLGVASAVRADGRTVGEARKQLEGDWAKLKSVPAACRPWQ